VNWHFSLDGLQAANDRVLRLMDRLELPNLARRLPDARLNSRRAPVAVAAFNRGDRTLGYTDPQRGQRSLSIESESPA
jgi:hypothetical protein